MAFVRTRLGNPVEETEMKRLLTASILVVATAALIGSALAGERNAPGPNAGGRGRDAMAQQIRDGAPPDIKALIDKQLAGERLAPEEADKVRAYTRDAMRGRARPGVLDNAPADIKAIAEKRARGEQLTAEEQQKVDNYMRQQAANVRVRPGMMGNRIAQGQAQFFVHVDANPRDAALLHIAEIMHKQGKNQEALDGLAKVIKESPQAEVCAAAHLDSARIYRKNLLLPDKAAEEFLAVRGPLATIAIRELSEMFEETGEPERAVALLKAAVEKAQTKADKLPLMAGIADVYERAGQLDNAVTALQEIINLVSYEEAMQTMGPLPRPGLPGAPAPVAGPGR